MRRRGRRGSGDASSVAVATRSARSSRRTTENPCERPDGSHDPSRRRVTCSDLAPSVRVRRAGGPGCRTRAGAGGRSKGSGRGYPSTGRGLRAAGATEKHEIRIRDNARVRAPASTVLSPAPAGISTPPPPPQVIGHWQVHVEGQAEATVHGGVCCATHVFELTERQVLPASQMIPDGKPESGGGRNGGTGTALHGTARHGHARLVRRESHVRLVRPALIVPGTARAGEPGSAVAFDRARRVPLRNACTARRA